MSVVTYPQHKELQYLVTFPVIIIIIFFFKGSYLHTEHLPNITGDYLGKHTALLFLLRGKSKDTGSNTNHEPKNHC